MTDKADLAKRTIADFLDRNAPAFAKLSDSLFYFSELGMQEHRSAKLMGDLLEGHGFSVDRKPSGFETGFVARYGRGRPVIAIHTEYDANPGNSQQSGVDEPREIVAGAPGHCEGHNVNAACMVSAALALKQAIDEHEFAGEIRIIGAPGEEQLISRPYYVRDGLFDDVDIALHPHILDEFRSDFGLIQAAAVSVDFHFSGRSAHAAVAPWDGRDALDAVILMDSGMAQLREHMMPGLTMHRVVTHGGEQPNVIPARASVWWYFRGPTAESVDPLFARARDVAKGAALMTGCEVETSIRAAVWPVLLTEKVAEVIQRNIDAVGMPGWTEGEQDFARRLQRAAGKPEIGLRPAITPFSGPAQQISASNDCGDISWKVPMGRLWFPANVPHIPFHHWAGGAALATSIAHRGGLAGARVLAGTVVDYLTDPALVEEARTSFRSCIGDTVYHPLIPLDQIPPRSLNAGLMERYRPAMEAFYPAGEPVFT
ncbi:aminobenzoyl-glutamate utilization protein B [Xaviernesmea oryzae]|uniref:Aminobenzoyl-glutamate utilization protein B n=1 Tax=Xaviernesmea oryzae TaxID=464029 RepID=A0A1X7G1S2_9HYPH|nr:amidohydrolase [Xaviernesmea oryzae]SMF62446.1 aminobenzoyl-glutamate utilization protein B [Xaviernesmea oryzae]